MDLKYQPFVQILQRLQSPIKDKHRIAAIAIGYACACSAGMPSAEVENAELHYVNNVEALAKRIISAFNEATVIDTASALAFSRSFWLLRYDAIHKCPRLESIPGDFFSSVFGVSKYFSADLIDFANKNNEEISFVYTHVCNVIKEHFTGG